MIARTRQLLRKHPECTWLSIILIVGLALRLIRLGSRPYWHDEAYNLIKTLRIWGVVTRGDFVSNDPPGFAILCTIWRWAGLGYNEWTMRLLVALIGLAGVGAVYWAGKRLFDSRTGLVAAWIVALSPVHVVHSQDLKAYILLPLTGIFTVMTLYIAAESNKVRHWVAYAAAAGLACYSHTSAAPLLVGINIWFLLQLKGCWNRIPGWIAANVAGALLFIPYLSVLTRRANAMLVESSFWWVPVPTPYSVFLFVKTAAYGYAADVPLMYAAVALFAGLACLGTVWAFRAAWRSALLVLCWCAVPIAVMYALSHVMHSIFLLRALIPFMIPLYLAMAFAIAKIRFPVVRGLLVCVIALVAAAPLAQRYADIYTPEEFPFRPGIHPPQAIDTAAQYIVDHWQEGDVVVHTSNSTYLSLWWYGVQYRPQVFGAIGRDFIEMMLAQNIRNSDWSEIDGYFPREIQTAVDGYSRVWLVFSEWERAYLKDNPTRVWRWLDAHFHEMEHLSLQNLDVLLYANENDGVPIEVRERDADRAASYRVAYEGGINGEYFKNEPDNTLNHEPVLDRQGKLTLQFAETGSPDRSFAQTPDTKRVAFSISNASATPVSARVVCVPSDGLLDLASLYEADPNQDAWRIDWQHNPHAPPQNYALSAAVATMDQPGSAAMHGQMPIRPGAYTTQIYMFGRPGDGSMGRLDLGLVAGSINVFEALRDRNGADGWSWWMGMPITVEASGTPLPVTLTASYAESWSGPRYGDLGYLALTKRRHEPVTGSPTAQAPMWPGNVTIAGNATESWTVELDNDAGRVDVWVYEEGEGGQAYRIFRRFGPIVGAEALLP